MATLIRTIYLIRSRVTGLVLPRVGTLKSIKEQLGRKMYLVDFGTQKEYLFDGEFEFISSSTNGKGG